jgi:hypothetical protein
MNMTKAAEASSHAVSPLFIILAVGPGAEESGESVHKREVEFSTGVHIKDVLCPLQIAKRATTSRRVAMRLLQGEEGCECLVYGQCRKNDF